MRCSTLAWRRARCSNDCGRYHGTIARLQTAVLDLAYEHGGPEDAPPVVLRHAYPCDVRAFDAVVPIITSAGCAPSCPTSVATVQRALRGSRGLPCRLRRCGAVARTRTWACDVHWSSKSRRSPDPAVDPERSVDSGCQFHVQTERGHRGLTEMRSELGRLVWRLWSPTWMCADTT
jgi:hypothetical protein